MRRIFSGSFPRQKSLTDYTAAVVLGGLAFGVSLLAPVAPAQATILSVTGPASLMGDLAAIIAPPADVNNSAAFNTAQQGFNEIQNLVLPGNIAVDAGLILAGTTISSHMIFLNNDASKPTVLNEHQGVQWTFDGIILGVMSDFTGSLEIATSPLLGAAGTLYPVAPFNARGIESDDSYSFLGNVLTFNSRIREPGDWIRVITASETNIPEPASWFLLGSGLVGLLARNRRRS